MKTIHTLFIALLVCLSFRAGAQSSSKEFNKALKLFEKGNYEGAIEGFDKCINQKSGSRAYYGRGYAFFFLEKYDEALRDFKKFRSIAPEDPDGMDAISMVYFHQNDFQSLKDSVAAFMKIGTTEYNNNYYLGYAEYHLGNDSTALEYLNYHLQLEPEHQNALYTRALVHLVLENVQEAENDLSKLITVNPSYSQAIYLRAAIKSERNENWAALDDINRVIELNPKDLDALELKGDIYDNLGDSVKAEELYLKVLSMKSEEDYELLYQIAKLEFYKFHNYDKTLTYLNRLLATEHNYTTSALYLRAVTNTRLKKYEAAELDFANVSQRDTTNFEISLYWAELEIEKEDFTAALTYLKHFRNQIGEIDKDDNAYAYKLEGQAYLGQKRFQLATETLQKAITFVDDAGEPYYLLGKALQGLKKTEEACKAFTKANELGYEDALSELKENCGYVGGEDDEAETAVGII